MDGVLFTNHSETTYEQTNVDSLIVLNQIII